LGPIKEGADWESFNRFSNESSVVQGPVLGKNENCKPVANSLQKIKD
jgi:hypothetical protein